MCKLPVSEGLGLETDVASLGYILWSGRFRDQIQGGATQSAPSAWEVYPRIWGHF